MIVSRDYIRDLLEGIFNEGKVAYDHFSDTDIVQPPFAAFYYSAPSDNFFADGRVYAELRTLYIESYSETAGDDARLQGEIEAALDAAGLPWQKESEWIESEKLFLTAYSMEVLANVQE